MARRGARRQLAMAASFAIDPVREIALILGPIDGRIRGRIDDQVGSDAVERRCDRLRVSEVEDGPRRRHHIHLPLERSQESSTDLAGDTSNQHSHLIFPVTREPFNL